MKVAMSRVINETKRYYKIEILPNLFGEWVLVRSYGSIKSRPRMKAEVFEKIDYAQAAFERLLGMKMKKGYMPTIKL
jgi:predicted DNA-binding WGR domain protein